MRVVVRGTAPCDIALARRAMRIAARPYPLPPGTVVTLAFVDDAEMRALNRRYRGKDRTTDVLSFGEAFRPEIRGAVAASRLRPGPDGTIELGDVVVSGAQAARQARRRRWPLASEVAFLAAHGTLHLLGFEDETPRGYREMLALGREALSAARQ
ncbi:MAG TPA: rRNA maturation RNase YbeY [Candidatus Limnocylindria bacterium]